MRNAVFLFGLCGRHLVVTMEDQILVLDREQSVGTPLSLVGCAAARLRSSSPFVGEKNFRSIVAERCRMPEGHVGVAHHIDAERMCGILNVEQKPEAGAG